MTWSACDSNLVLISSLDSKWQGLKFAMSVFQLFYEMKLKTSKFSSLGILRPVKTSWQNSQKSQTLHIIRIKYCNAGGSGSPPSLISAFWNIGILLHKQANILAPSVSTKSGSILEKKKCLQNRYLFKKWQL